MRRLLVLVVAISPRLAGANAAAPIPAPTLSAIGPVGAKTPLTLDIASLRIDCERRDECTLEVRYAIVPALAAASAWIVLVPSVGVGVGVPMRVSPSFEVGGRAQIDAHYGPVGYFVAFDWYPGMDAGPRRFEVSMMTVLSI